MPGPSKAHLWIRTAIGLGILIPGLFVTSAVAFGVAFFGGSQRAAHRYGYLAYCRLCMRLGGTQLIVKGSENIDTARAYVVVPNHGSNWDAPLTVASLPELVLRFVIKDELMRVPVFGHALKQTGNVHVIRRKDTNTGDVKRIDEMMAGRAPDVSLLFFAEGTRSSDGSVGEFKKGAFATAIGYGLPILPVAISGSHEVWPPGTVRLRPGPVCVEIGAAIETDGVSYEDREKLRSDTQALVREMHERATRLRLELEAAR